MQREDSVVMGCPQEQNKREYWVSCKLLAIANAVVLLDI
jgi:hypothetical protein